MKKRKNKLSITQHALTIISNARVGSIGKVVGYSTVGLLSLVLLTMLCPMVGTNANAEELQASLSTKTTAYLYSMISLSTSNSIDINLIPKSSGALAFGEAKLKVASNNTTGYSLYLSTVDQTNKLNQVDSSLQYTDTQAAYAINPLVGSVTAENYLKNPSNLNTWSYALTDTPATSSTEYSGLESTSGDLVYSAKGSANSDDYTLSIAVAADATLPAGGYRNGLIVTAVANPITLSGFNQIYYMQDMTPSICDSATMEETGQLVDRRDNNIYWVAKLKDGNCWMTQNLALDLSTEVALTPEDSDVSSSWIPSSTTETTIPAKTSADYTSERSWGFGKILLTNPTTSTKCNSISTGGSITECQWYRDTTGLMSGYSATETSSISPDGQSYDAHYLIGNYYQWNAATAGSGILTNEENTGNIEAATNPTKLVDATSSICPKGWKMPTSGRNTTEGNGWPFDREDSFYRLLRAYGYPETGSSVADTNLLGTHWVGTSDTGTAIVGPGKTRVDYKPIYFVRTGDISTVNGILTNPGTLGVYWSSTAYRSSSTDAYRALLSTTSINPSTSYYRYYGYSVRCLAK